MPVLHTLFLPFTYSWRAITNLSPLFTIPALLLGLVVGLYSLWFMLETPVAFAYAGDNCVNKLTFFPDSQQTSRSSPFLLDYKHKLTFFNVNVTASEVCFTLKKEVAAGSHAITTSPFNNWMAQSTYQVHVAPLPKISLSALRKPIPLTKPVVLGISSEDEIHDYALQANERETMCEAATRSITCDLTSLELAQGETYEFAIARYFKDTQVATVVKQETEILKATTVTETSIKPDEVVLSKPTELTVTFDKPIKIASAALAKLGEEKRESIEVKTEVGEKSIKVTFAELPRSSEFELMVDKLEAVDGSSLVDAYKLKFEMSGGPRVASVSIPKTGVALGATAVIKFDQPLLAEQNLPSMLTVEGGNLVVNRRGDTLTVSLAGVARCSDVRFKLGNEVQSIYGVSGNSAWDYAARTVCHSIETIGYSVRGRAINAYVFGNGGTTILYTGAIHGNELSSSYLMDAWITELEANARNLPSGKQIVVIPEVNPDGIARGTRNNANNVDLNRNFAVSDWRADITDVYGNPIKNGGGTEAMSEPETKALANYTSRLRPRLTMSFHSIGGLVIANQAGDSSSLASAYSRLTGYGNATGQSSTTFDYAISGTYDDWIAEKLGLPSVLVELGSHTYSQFPLNKSALWDMARR